MHFTFLVNAANKIQPAQTTAMLIAAAQSVGHRVRVVGVQDLVCDSQGRPWATGQRLDQTDVLWIRTNPARDLSRRAAHQFALAIAQRCEDQGVRVLNRPRGLQRAATKLYLLELPESVRPATMIGQDLVLIRTFIDQCPTGAVLKPVQGTRGQSVFFVKSSQDPNLNQIIEAIANHNLVMVQACIPGAEAGDTRVIVLGGKILELQGHSAAIQRVPQTGDFRSNLHAGGSAEPARITPEMRQVVAAIAPKLQADGLWLVGLDFIGNQILELNVFSTGGLRDAERFTGQNFAEEIIRMAEKEQNFDIHLS